MIIIVRFGENVLCPKYIDICEFRGGMGGMYMVHRAFFLFIVKKKYKSMNT